MTENIFTQKKSPKPTNSESVQKILKASIQTAWILCFQMPASGIIQRELAPATHFSLVKLNVVSIWKFVFPSKTLVWLSYHNEQYFLFKPHWTLVFRYTLKTKPVKKKKNPTHNKTTHKTEYFFFPVCKGITKEKHRLSNDWFEIISEDFHSKSQ